MNKKKKYVRYRRTAAWILTACLLTGPVFAGAAEDVPQEEPGLEADLEPTVGAAPAWSAEEPGEEAGLELVMEEDFEKYEMPSGGQDAEEEPIFLEEDGWMETDDSGSEADGNLSEDGHEPNDSQAVGEETGSGASEDQTEEDAEREPGTEESGNESVSEGVSGNEEDGNLSEDDQESGDSQEPEFGLLDMEDLGDLTAEELSLLTDPDDPAAVEAALLSVREAQAASAEASAYASPDLSEKFSEIYSRAGSYLYGTVTDPIINSTGGDWAVLGLARAGYPAGSVYYTKYAKNVSDGVTRVGGVLSDVKYTEYSRVILGLTAAGYDAGNVAGYDLLAPLSDLESVAWQGINGPIWALIALDSHGYEVRQAPEGKTQATRQNLIGAILEGQLDDGGWSIAGFSADPDMTAMAVMALTPYYRDGGTWAVYGQSVTVRQAVDRALDTLSSIQDASGGYASYNEPNSESCAQVLTALAGFGIDPEQDTRFQKNGRSVLDALLSYADGSGGFCHTQGTGVNGMSCEQTYYALAAYSRYLNGQNRLYDMSDVASLQAVPKPEDFVLDPGPETEDSSGGDENNKPGGAGDDGSDGSDQPGGSGGTGDDGSDGNDRPGGSGGTGDDGSDGNDRPGGSSGAGDDGSDGNDRPGGSGGAGDDGSDGNDRPGGSGGAGDDGSDGNDRPGGSSGAGDDGSDGNDWPGGSGGAGDDGSDGNDRPGGNGNGSLGGNNGTGTNVPGGTGNGSLGGNTGDGTNVSGGTGENNGDGTGNGSGSGGTSRPGGSTHSLGNTTGSGSSSKGSSSSGGSSSAGQKLAEGMAEVTLDGKRYVVEERAASLIERIRELSGSGGFADGGMSGESDSVQGPDESEMEALVQIYREYLELSEEQQAYVLNYDVMEEMTEQAGERNHLDQNTKIRAEGVEWYIRLEVSPVAETDVFYRELQSSIGSGTLRTLYRIGFTDLLTGEEYQPEREVALTIPADSVLRKAGAEPEAPDHEMEGESSQGQNEGTDGAGLNGGSAAGDVGSSQGQNEGTDGAGLNGGSAAGDAGSSSGPAGGDMEGEQFLVILVGEDGSIWYPDFVSEDGAFLLKAKDFTHFGIAAALAESSLVLEDETESETENETETDAVTEAERVPETESESETETAVAAAGFGGPMVILWIVMLVVGTNILVLSFLGKKGYLNFPGEE